MLFCNRSPRASAKDFLPHMDFLEGLNPPQREAVAHVEGPLLLLAGAGSGKTRVITHRIAHLIDAHHVPGPCVLAVTFTNKAAAEMRERVVRLLNDPTTMRTPLVSTFHSFCVRLLRRDGASLDQLRPGFTRQFNIYDDDDQLALIKSAYKDLALDDTFLPYRGALSRISHAKNQHATPEDWLKNVSDPKAKTLAKIFELYEDRLQQANALDFDDLLLESVRLLQHDSRLRELCNRRYEFLMIDEYQDTNRSQYELMLLLSELRHNVCVVGDEDQSIYGWRGADIRNILDFEKDYPDAVVIRLEQNYRSTKNILEAASSVVANNLERKGKWLWTDQPDGLKIGLFEAADGEQEALFIADTIERIFAKSPDEHVAVLYRTNSQSRQIEEALRRYGRKYLVVGGFSFYQRAEVKDVLSYLKVASSPVDSISLLRIINTPARGIGKGTIDQISQFRREKNVSAWEAIRQLLEERAFPARAEAALRSFVRLIGLLGEKVQSEKAHKALEAVLDTTGYRSMLKADTTEEGESRLQNIDELLRAAEEGAERGESVSEFLDHAALVSDADQVNEHAAVSLLTAHNAKGLEFPVVFLAGMEEGLFPHSRSVGSEPAMEEERRLCYVGMTRARKRLYLTWARYRRRYGSGSPEACIRSRFVGEVPPSLCERLSTMRGAAASEVDLYSEQHEVRESARKNLFTGRTVNSVENIAQFFTERGMPVPSGLVTRPQAEKAGSGSDPGAPRKVAGAGAGVAAGNLRQMPGPASKSRAIRAGVVVEHEKYGRGTVMRREGEGEDAKLTISFAGHGLKKIIEKYARITVKE
jgi:DNA helicase-2/ATP-dependent DNA helicase PcrA